MKKIIKNNYKIIIGIIIGILISITSVYAIEAYIESKKVSYDNHNKKITTKENVQEAIDELYERSGIHQEKWVDPVLNGADPVLKEPLIPVEIKPNGDVYYANLNSEWYNYSEKRWANAVILKSSSKEYTTGNKITPSDIQSYFVWIPRYQYRIWDLGKYNSTTDISTVSQIKKMSRIIDVNFGTAETIKKMEESVAKVGEYYTHPAFTIGDKNLNGIWVSKFDTGLSSNSTGVGQTTASKIVILPNHAVWAANGKDNLKVMFEAAYYYQRDLDSHMMKNTEWGAIAYLSHSAYGIGTEVNINNHSVIVSGYSAFNVPPGTHGTTTNVTQPWNTPTGYLASTTGNISGVYDMSGCDQKFMAACVDGNPGGSTFTNEELKTYMDQGYIDKYKAGNNNKDYTNRILGDATGEMGPFYTDSSLTFSSWYSDYALFITSDTPWMSRWGNPGQGIYTGQFAFHSRKGNDTGLNIRLVLAIN